MVSKHALTLCLAAILLGLALAGINAISAWFGAHQAIAGSGMVFFIASLSLWQWRRLGQINEAEVRALLAGHLRDSLPPARAVAAALSRIAREKDAALLQETGDIREELQRLRTHLQAVTLAQEASERELRETRRAGELAATVARLLAAHPPQSDAAAFLTQELVTPTSVDSSVMSTWALADEIAALVAPLATQVNVHVNRQCPANFVCEQPIRHYLFHYMIAVIDQSPAARFLLEVTPADNALTFRLTPGPRPLILPAPLRQLDDTIGLSHHGLTLPVTQVLARRPRAGGAQTALVMAGDEATRRCLEDRIRQLGARVITNFADVDPDLLLLDQPDADALAAVRSQLPRHTRIIELVEPGTTGQEGQIALSRPLQQASFIDAIARPTLRESAEGDRPVLAVDDNATSLQMLSGMLRRLGYEVATANSAEEAIALADKLDLEVAFIDAHLPGLTTPELARQLTRRHPRIVLHCITAGVSASEEQDIRAAGIRRVLLKPVTPTALASAVSERHRDGYDAPVFDPAMALDAAQGSYDLAIEMADVFTREARSDQLSINDALNAGNTTAAASALHRFRGSLSYCGFPRLNASADGIDSALRRDDIDAARLESERLAAEVTSTLQWLRDHPDPFDS